MKILAVEPRDIHVVLELSAKELNMLLDFLGASKVEFDSKDNPEMAKAVKWVGEDLFKVLDELSSDIRREHGS